ncbi:MAG: glycosyltransferase [Spirochaetes bacterium]|nr:glycosyltransferase [Spirochaetota bacterium]
MSPLSVRGVIRVITHDENRGICESLNDGIRRSYGELIAIQHAYDISLPGRLAMQTACLDSHPDIDLVPGWIDI